MRLQTNAQDHHSITPLYYNIRHINERWSRVQLHWDWYLWWVVYPGVFIIECLIWSNLAHWVLSHLDHFALFWNRWFLNPFHDFHSYLNASCMLVTQQNESWVNLVQRGGYAPLFQNIPGVKTPLDISKKWHCHLKSAEQVGAATKLPHLAFCEACGWLPQQWSERLWWRHEHNEQLLSPGSNDDRSADRQPLCQC